MKTIVFRVDASVRIGSGHVMRCLVLANMLRENGATIIFVCRELQGNLICLIENHGFSVIRLSGQVDDDATETQAVLSGMKIDWLIIDHYQIDYKWEKKLRSIVGHMMVIDDLANRHHDCDILLDQNFYKQIETRYIGLVPDHCICLLGPSYLLLRPEFLEARKQLTERDGVVRRLFIFYGGSDPTNDTMKALHALSQFPNDAFHVDVVVGLANPNREEVKKICGALGFRYHCQIDYMAELMAKADLAIGAGGVALWERCFLELPSITTIVAENQMKSTEAAANHGAIWNLGWHESVNQEILVDILNRALNAPDEIRKLSQRSRELLNLNQFNHINPIVKVIFGE